MQISTLDLLHEMDSYMLLRDVAPVLLTLAVAVSVAETDGVPCWLLVVGASSGGKSEIIGLTDRLVTEPLKDVTAASLLSWSAKASPKTKPEQVGVLVRAGSSPALFSVADLSPILSDSAKGNKDHLFALLRDCYDGRVQRALGNMPLPLRWHGRISLIAGVTPVVDQQRVLLDALGPRFLCVRLQPIDDVSGKRAVIMKALRAGDRGEARQSAQASARRLVLEAREELGSVELSAGIQEQVADAAIICALGRSNVPREVYGAREISDFHSTEEPTRIAGAMNLLARSLVALGESEEVALSLVRRVALDTLSRVRRDCIVLLADLDAPISTGAIARAVGADPKTIARALEDLERIGLAEQNGTTEYASEDEQTNGIRRARLWVIAKDWSDMLQPIAAAAKGTMTR